jgi:hypothetical protein
VSSDGKMSVPDKILLMWLAVIWTVFSVWVVTITPFPLNFGFVAFQLLTGIVLVWTMKLVYFRSKVPSE